VVNHQGVVQKALSSGRASAGLVALHPRFNQTPYSRWGEWPLLVLGAWGAIWRVGRTRWSP